MSDSDNKDNTLSMHEREDAVLDEITLSLKHLKENSIEINEELTEQQIILNNLNTNIDDTQTHLESNIKKIKRKLEEKSIQGGLLGVLAAGTLSLILALKLS